jgi:hypothetical protein
MQQDKSRSMQRIKLLMLNPYWAVYKRCGMVVIYNSPFADVDAYIYAILVNSNGFSMSRKRDMVSPFSSP